MIDWVSVRSKAIKRIGYDKSTSKMYIKFTSSNTNYEYCNVPEEVFVSFVNASSVGQYYKSYIDGNYNC